MNNESIYSKSAAFYDSIYRNKNYRKEAQYVHNLIKQYKDSAGLKLLDIACGTGGHIPYLSPFYEVQGLDQSASMLEIARQRNPKVHFHHQNMIDFSLEEDFDIAICLFSAIGYVVTVPDLFDAISNMGDHIVPGGILIVEPWDKVWEYDPNLLNAAFVDRPDMKVARMCSSRVTGKVSKVSVHYLVHTLGRIDHFVEEHELGIFTPEEYRGAFQAAGFSVIYDPEGVSGRGLYIGIKNRDAGTQRRLQASISAPVSGGSPDYL